MCGLFTKLSGIELTSLALKLNLRSSSFADKSVYVADAGSRLPALCSPCGRHLKKSSLSNHALHSATGEACGWDGTYTVQHVAVHTHTHTYTQRQSRHSWTLANRNRPCVCVVSLQWNISPWDQIGFDPALWASDSFGSSKYVLSLVQTHTHTHTTAREKTSWECIKVPTETHLQPVMHTVQKENSLPCQGNVRSNRAWHFRLSHWMVQMWSRYYLKIHSLISTVCGTVKLLLVLQSVKSFGGMTRDVSLDEAFHFSLRVCLRLTRHHSHKAHTQTLFHPSCPNSSLSFLCMLSSCVMYPHYIRLRNQVLCLKPDK